jgi:hypothetical protein
LSDSSTSSSYPTITRLDITNNGQTLNVHAYVKTASTDYDMGTESGTFGGEPFVIKFGIQFRLTLTLENTGIARVGGGTLKVVTDCPAPGTPCATGTHTFHRDQPPAQIKP